jgi:hypothetical protein
MRRKKKPHHTFASVEPAKPRRIRRVVSTTASIAWAALVALIVSAVGVFLYTALKPSQTPIPEQLAEVRRDAARRSQHPIADRAVALDRSGHSARLLVFRRDNPLSGPSDDFRVYRDDGPRLQLKFRFQPRGDPLPGDRLGAPRVVRLDKVGDVDGDGRQEIIGSWASFGMAPFAPVPFVLSYDDATKSYRLWPLIPTRPELAPVRQPGHAFFARHFEYKKPQKMPDLHGGRPFIGYGAEDYVLTKQAGVPVLLATYLARARSQTDPQLYEVTGWNLDVSRTPPLIWQCGNPSGIFVRPSPPTVSRGKSIVAAWRAAKPYC